MAQPTGLGRQVLGGNGSGGGGAFGGFGPEPPAIGAGTAGVLNTASRADHTHVWNRVATEAALAALPAADMEGGQQVWVDTFKDSFTLTLSSRLPAGNYAVAASGKAGYVWIRDCFSPGWWSQLSWYLTSSALANNENSGAIGFPISPQEYRRRHLSRQLPGTETASVVLNVTADLGDNDYIQPSWSNGLRGGSANLSINGVQTVVATGVIATAVAPNRATNASNDIDAGFAWAAHVGRIVRLQGTTTTTAVVMADLGGTTARLGEQSVAGVTGAGFTVGQTVEVVTMAKVPGIHVQSGPNVVLAFDLMFDSATTMNLRGDSELSNFNFSRCHFRGGATGQITATNIGITACSLDTRTWTMRGLTGLILSTQVNQAGAGTVLFAGQAAENSLISHTSQASTLTVGDLTFLHLSGSGSANAGFFDLAPGQTGINVLHKGHYDGAGMWGSGNDATSIAIALDVSSGYSHAAGVSSFTIAGTVGLRMVCGGVAQNVPLAQLPHAIGPGVQPASSNHFTAALTSSVGGAVFAYAACSDVATPNQPIRQGFPTSEKLALRLRTRVADNALGVGTVVTVYKNGVATGMTLTIGAGAAVGTKQVDSANPTLFVDGDDYDIRADAAVDAEPGTIRIAAQIEWAG